MAMAGLLGHILMAFMLTTSTSMVVTSTRQTTTIVGTAFLSAACFRVRGSVPIFYFSILTSKEVRIILFSFSKNLSRNDNYLQKEAPVSANARPRGLQYCHFIPRADLCQQPPTPFNIVFFFLFQVFMIKQFLGGKTIDHHEKIC